MKRILAVILTLALLLSAAPGLAQEAADTMVVTGGWLRLRSAPGYDAETISSYYTGTKVTVLGIANGWYHVRTPDGLTGYMHGDYLTAATQDNSTAGSGGAVNPDPSPAPQQATVTSANGMGVKLRTGPSTGYGVIMVVPVGTVATILLEGDQWHYVRIGDKMGYMMAQFLSTGAQVNTGGYLARVTSANGLGVRLRSGPGTGYDVLGVYSVGTAVTVISYGPTWCQIRVGSRTGYMMTQFLTTSQVVATIQSVTVSNTAPAMGDVLTATVRPAGATVTYRWTDANGNLLSTASSYTVSAYDVGRRIRVTVTGTGMYSGSASSSLTGAVTYSAALTGVTLSITAPVVGDTISATAQPAGASASYAWYRSDGSYLGSGRTYRVQSGDVGYMLYCKATGSGSYTGEVYSAYTNAVTYTAVSSGIAGTLTLPSTVSAGATVTATANLNVAGPMVAYSWFVDGEEISGATGRSFTTDATMIGKTLRVMATAMSGSGYAGTLTSNSCTVVAGYTGPEQLSGQVSIPASATVGEVIYADLNLNSGSVTYAWYLNGSRISGANGNALTLNSAMAGKSVYVVVTAADSDYTGSLTSNSCYVQPQAPAVPEPEPDLATGTDFSGGGGSIEQYQ